MPDQRSDEPTRCNSCKSRSRRESRHALTKSRASKRFWPDWRKRVPGGCGQMASEDSSGLSQVGPHCAPQPAVGQPPMPLTGTVRRCISSNAPVHGPFRTALPGLMYMLGSRLPALQHHRRRTNFFCGWLYNQPAWTAPASSVVCESPGAHSSVCFVYC